MFIRTHREPLLQIFPWMQYYPVMPRFRFYINNSRTLRTFIEKLAADRKAGKTTGYHGAGEKDLFDLLIEEEWYATRTNRLIDDIIIMFMAGMETI